MLYPVRDMQYVSTRGRAAPRDFEGVLLAGLAEDGGLFLPESWPELGPAEWRALRGLLGRLRSELGRLNPTAEIDPRFVAGLVLAP